MKIQTLNLKLVLLTVFTSALLIACSVEQKPLPSSGEMPNIVEVPTATSNDPPMITNPEDIVLPPADYIEQPQQVIPDKKPSLTKQQLFAGTLNAHNRVRTKHGLQPLRWSDKLAAYSQQWADMTQPLNTTVKTNRLINCPIRL